MSIFVVAAILIGGGIFVVLRNTEGDTPQTTEVQLDGGCKEDTECVLVQDGWCKTVLAVRKNKETEWKETQNRLRPQGKINRRANPCQLNILTLGILEPFAGNRDVLRS